MTVTGIKRTGRIILYSIKRYIDNDGFVYSSSISFNVLIAAVPLLCMLLMVTGFFIPQIVSDRGELAALIDSFFPYSTDFIIQNIDLLYSNRGTLGVVGLLALFTATLSLTNSIHISLAAMITGGKGKKFMRMFLSHAAGIILFSILLLLVIMGGTLLSLFQGLAAHVEASILKLILNKTLSFIHGSFPPLLIAITTSLVYRHLSPIHIPGRAAIIGGIFFTALVFISKWIIFLYVGKVSKLSLIYGSIFGVICFIIASYVFASVFLFTACAIAEYLEGKALIQG